ncbi:hypothetical protein [Rhodanobacter sp. T12-5]|uniref:hypothetical protein n=1 Tax=Rhodanobacter sp. T12-5 TaxID=2024611 RepID=UPI001562CFBF|nr:hypothetical protein [Rhodanobacter sp. T12-5]
MGEASFGHEDVLIEGRDSECATHDAAENSLLSMKATLRGGKHRRMPASSRRVAAYKMG